MKFENKNVNPKNRKTGDCVVRALTVASGKPYLSVYKELFDISVASGYMLNEKRTYDKFLEQNGFVKHKQPRKWDGRKYTISEIKAVTDAKIIVVSCANHLTAIIDDTLIDTWDCQYKCISNYYTK